MSLHKCIYCLNEKAEESFDKEHVIPQNFGTFSGSSPVLSNCEVCKECNGNFGSTIDNNLTRLSPYSILKSMFLPNNTYYSQRTFIEKVGQPYRGARMEFSWGDNGVLNHKFLTQVGLKRKLETDYTFFTFEELKNFLKKETLGPSHRFFKGDAVCVYKNDEQLEALYKKVLNDLKIGKKEDVTEKLTGKDYFQATYDLFDRDLLRAFFKVGFNYLTFCTSKQYVLQPEFNFIRNFIRNDDAQELPPVDFRSVTNGILNFENVKHKITLEWIQIKHESSSLFIFSLIARVTFFSSPPWIITFTKEILERPFGLPKGHIFELSSMTASSFDPKSGGYMIK